MNEGFRTLLVEVTNSGTSQEPQVSLIHVTRVDFFQFDQFDRFDFGAIPVQNQGNFSQQQKPNRNCHVCGDHANGFNLNVPR